MTLKESLNKVVEELPQERQRQVLDFARFLASQRDADQWSEAAREHFARAFGPDEPEYTPADIRPESNR